jgi:hypothetical protein
VYGKVTVQTPLEQTGEGVALTADAGGAVAVTATKEIIGAIKDQINICTKPLRRAL